MRNSIRLHRVNVLYSRVKLILLLLSIFVGYIARPALGDRRSDYEKINDYLIRNVKNSHEPSINVDALEKWNSTTCCQTCYRRHYESKPTYCETLNRLILLPKIVSVWSCNQESANTLVEFDSDLGDYAQPEPDNFPYTRIQRIIERYAYDWSVMCFGTGCCKRSKMPYLFRERAYDQINSYLVNQTKSADAELNMAKADEYLETLIRDQEQEGVKTDALRQLVAIRSVADEKMCNGKGFEIMFKNDLATGGSAHTNKMQPIRRIDKLVHHYSLKNAKLCQPVYRKKFEDRIKLLDRATYRNVLTLVGMLVERPHPPESITAELFDKLSTSVRIKWTPAFDGNSPIEKYMVEMRTVDNDTISNEVTPSHVNLWEVAQANISADQTSVIIPNLKPAGNYLFRITAINSFGTSEPSLPTKPPVEVPLQAPIMPIGNLAAIANSSTPMAPQWQPSPADTGVGVSTSSIKVGQKFSNNSKENLTGAEKWAGNQELSGWFLRKCLLFSSKGDPEAIYLSRVPDEISGEYVVVEEKVRELFDKYLVKPCQNFIGNLGFEVFRPSSYAKIIDGAQNEIQSYYPASAAYESCRAFMNNGGSFNELVASYPRVAGKSSFYDN